jgi:CRP-like cAMP-binding protein
LTHKDTISQYVNLQNRKIYLVVFTTKKKYYVTMNTDNWSKISPLNYINVLLKNDLFKNISPENLTSMLHCLSFQVKKYSKGSQIFTAGEVRSEGFPLGIIVEGQVELEHNDYWGYHSIIETLKEGQTFGEAAACSDATIFPTSVRASENTIILFGNYKKMTTTCKNACHHHTQLVQNMIQVLARKNFLLTQKIDHLSRRTTREKIISYLSDIALREGCASDKVINGFSFDIPYDRQQLADFLAVERSALSTSLGKLKKDGIIDYNKNHFTLYEMDQN